MANSEWLDGMLNPQIKKEAMESQGTDKQNHFDRKVEAHPWVESILELDPVQVEAEYRAKLAAEAMTLGKTAALDDVIADGTTPEEVVNRDYKRDVISLSDYALAEMLAEARGHKAQNTNEMFYELKETAKKEVASSRDKAEKALLEMIPDNTQLDWQKAFKQFTKDAVPAEAKEKDLFRSDVLDKEHDFQHPTEEKFKLPKDAEKAIPGNGREADERKEVTQEAGVLQADIVEGITKAAALEKKAAVTPSGLKDKLMEMGYSEESANAISGQWQAGEQIGTEPKTKLDVEKALSELSKTADGPSATDNCPVCGSEGTDLGNDMEDNMACQSCGITYGSFKVADLETDGIASDEEIAESFINGNISWVKKEIAGDMAKAMGVLEALEQLNPESAASFKKIIRNAEIKSHATKAEVIKKIAELQKIAEVRSPWEVTVDENGQEVIARVDHTATNVKKSEEDKIEELQK